MYGPCYDVFGGVGGDMMENKKRKRIILGVLILVVALIWSLPKKKEYIQTPSTHAEAIFLDVPENKFSNGSKIWFALYDPECEYIELCLSFPQGDVDPFIESHRMEVVQKEETQMGWSFISHSGYRQNIWRQHLVILIEVGAECNELTFRYLGEEVTIAR